MRVRRRSPIRSIHRLIDLVRVGDPPREDAARYRQGATVTIRTHDGRVSTSTVYVPKGAGALGIAWSDVDAKYRTLVPAAGLPAQAIEASPRGDPRVSAGGGGVGVEQSAAFERRVIRELKGDAQK